MQVKNYSFKKLTRITGVGTIYSEWTDVGISKNMLAFIKLTAQGGYTDETINISVQIRTPAGDVIDITDSGTPIKFTEIGDATALLPFLDYIPFTAFGSLIRFKIVTTGVSPDYTFELTGYGKG